MTINYTTLLGLAKPVTGTESGAWGDVVNDQITSLLEDAVANAATINVGGGNVTLTDNNGAADQSRMAILLVTGSPGTSRNIVAPSTSKWYIVRNGSDSSVVVKGSATTGVTIPTGSDALVFWNGSDFEIAAVAGPASSTDNAVVRYDGTTGKVVQNSSVTIDDSNNVAGVAQLSTSGSVGVGTAVGAETLVVAGNSSVDIYKLRSNTSVPTTTDAFIYRPANNTLALGTASTEQVRIDSSGNVGVGTTSPSGASGRVLEVNGGAGQARLVLKNNTTGSASTDGSQIALVNSQLVIQNREASEIVFETNGAEQVRIDSSGNVGIGGITTPLSRLDVLTAGGNCLGTFRNGTTTAQVGVTSSGGGQAYFGSTTNHLTRLIQNGTTQFQISTTGLVQMDNGYGSLATFYGCRAWINFNGTTVTNPASMTGVRGSGNVSSVLDNGTGDYTINFSSAMPDVNYAVVGTAMLTNEIIVTTPGTIAYNTGSIRIGTRGGAGGLADPTYVNLAIFR